MIMAIDVHYRENYAKVASVLFNWEDSVPKEVVCDYCTSIEEYVPGEFYKRELPCLLKLIKKIDLSRVDLIIVDGHVYLDNIKKLGLGGMLWESLEKQIPVIGVAKTSFFNNNMTTIEVFRGESKKPLYVSTINYELEKAVENIKNMKGSYRIPDILKLVDDISKSDIL